MKYIIIIIGGMYVNFQSLWAKAAEALPEKGAARTRVVRQDLAEKSLVLPKKIIILRDFSEVFIASSILGSPFPDFVGTLFPDKTSQLMRNNSASFYEAAVALYRGNDSVPQNLQQAFLFMEVAASRHHIAALNFLGRLHEGRLKGLEEKDRRIALEFYSRSQTHPDSLVSIGRLLLYRGGGEIPLSEEYGRREDIAERCYRQAVRLRHLPAYSQLADLLIQTAEGNLPRIRGARDLLQEILKAYLTNPKPGEREHLIGMKEAAQKQLRRINQMIDTIGKDKAPAQYYWRRLGEGIRSLL